MRRWSGLAGPGPTSPGRATAGAVILALAVVLASGAVPFAHGPSGLPVTPAIAGACPGAAAPPTATGTLDLVGAATPLPSVVGVPVRVDYFYTEITKEGTSSTDSCIPANATATTGTGGQISVPLPIPASRCVETLCEDYAGPYGPLGYTTSGAPAGFFEVDPTTGVSPGTLDWEADLAAAEINVTGPRSVSVGAPTALSVSATNAAGGPAAAPLAYQWSWSGLEWSVSPNDTQNVTAVGLDPTWVGAIWVAVTGTYGSTVETVDSPALSLDPVATAVTATAVSPSPVDPGVPVTFSAQATGAGGYPYSFTVDPGLGAAPARGLCTAVDLPNGTANLTCAAVGAYPASGNTTPTASVSNGYSTAQTFLPPVSVRPVEEVSIDSTAFVAYTNRTVVLTVRVANATGTPPYGPACLSTGRTAGTICEFTNASSWNFSAAFALPGEYDVRATVADHFGENVSATAGILIVPTLAAHAEGNSTLSLRANQTQALTALVTGGDPPFSSRWNSSGTALPWCNSVLEIDGLVSCSISARTQGWANVTLTVTDALGSTASVLFQVNVTPAAPTPGEPGPGGAFSRATLELLAVGVVAVAAVSLLLVLRRRTRSTPGPVEEGELERIARGREHLLSHADPSVPRHADELADGWTGPAVHPEEWAEWIAALVADGSLVPVRTAGHRLAYRRASARPPAATIEFDPAVWEASRAAREPSVPEEPEDR